MPGPLLDPNALAHPYTWVGTAAVIVSAAATVYVHLARSTRAARLFVALAATSTVSALTVLIGPILLDDGLALLVGIVGIVTRIGLTPPLFLVFALVFADREDLLTRPVRAGIWGTGLFATVATLTNPADLLFSEIVEVQTGPLTTSTAFPGPLWPLLIVYTLGVLFLGLAVVADTSLRQSGTVRSGGLYFVLASVVSLGVGLVGLFELHPYPAIDIGVYGNALATPVLVYALRSHDLFDIQPVAHDRTLEHMQEATVVVDGDGVVLEANRRVAALSGLDRADLVGAHVDTLLDDWGIDGEVPEEFAVTTDGERRFLSLRRSAIDDASAAREVLVFADVTDQARQRRQLEHQNERLERFASTVSHDLRNPLATARMYASELDDGTEREAIVESLERMDDMIEDILSLARDGAAVTDPERVDVADLAREAWRGMDTDGATLSVDGEATVEGDPGRLRRVFENCYRNCLEHAGPAVSVRVHATASELRIEDDGPGIPPERRDSVFEVGVSTSDDGSGLGLEIVDTIASAHGWSVRAEESPLGGAAVVIDLERGPTPELATA